MRNAPQKRLNSDAQNTVQYSATFYKDQWQRMVKYRQESNLSVMGQIRRGVDLFLENKEVEPPKENTITFTVTPEQMQSLQKMADAEFMDVSTLVRRTALLAASEREKPRAVEKPKSQPVTPDPLARMKAQIEAGGKKIIEETDKKTRAASRRKSSAEETDIAA